MNAQLKELILVEHSKRQALFILAFVNDKESRFDDLMELFFCNKTLLAQRAAFAVSHILEESPQLAGKYEYQLVNLLNKRVHDANKRCIVKFYMTHEVSEVNTSLMIDNCFKLLMDPKGAIAIKASAMSVLFNFSKIYPDLQIELKAVIESQLKNGSTGFLNRANKILNHLNK